MTTPEIDNAISTLDEFRMHLQAESGANCPKLFTEPTTVHRLEHSYKNTLSQLAFVTDELLRWKQQLNRNRQPDPEISLQPTP